MPDQTNAIKALIEKFRATITKGQKPEGNCTFWNQDLSILLRMNGFISIPYSSSNYEVQLQKGGELVGHSICIVNTEKGWQAIDLTSEQVKELNPEKIWEAKSLKQLCETVNENLPQFMSYCEGDEEDIKEASRRSAEKDSKEGRYEKFRNNNSPESK